MKRRKTLGIEEGRTHRNASIISKLVNHEDWLYEYIKELAEVSTNYLHNARKEIANEEGRS